MKLRGYAHIFGDDINTDYIISVKRKRDTIDVKELAQYIMEDIDPDFYNRITPGDFIVAGKNFGCGSSREFAPLVILEAGIKAVIAKSFARIFYRNAINTGLLLIESDIEGIEQGDLLEIDVINGTLYNRSRNNACYHWESLPSSIRGILNSGGLVPYLKRKGELNI